MPSNTEGLPITLIESISCNIPSFAKDVGGIGSLLGDLGYDWKITGNAKEDSSKIISQIDKNFNFRDRIENRFSSKILSEKFFDEIIYSSDSINIWKTGVNPNSFFRWNILYKFGFQKR